VFAPPKILLSGSPLIDSDLFSPFCFSTTTESYRKYSISKGTGLMETSKAFGSGDEEGASLLY